jgi:uncharacterized membrane protein
MAIADPSDAPAGAPAAPVVARPSLADEREFGPWQHVLFLGSATLLTVAVYLLTRGLGGHRFANEMAAAGGASILGLGTSIILGGAFLEGTGVRDLTPWDIAMCLLYLNTVLAFVYGWSLDLFERIPRVGPALKRTRTQAHATVKERPWIRRWATVGVALFVLSPLPGSGVLGGSVVGHIAGLGRLRTFAAVTVANGLVCVLYAWFADALRTVLREHEVTLVERIAGLVILLALLWLLFRFLKRQMGAPGGRAPAPAPVPKSPSEEPTRRD